MRLGDFMKLKKIFISLLLFIVCIGCISAISAEDIDNNMPNIDPDTNIDSGNGTGDNINPDTNTDMGNNNENNADPTTGPDIANDTGNDASSDSTQENPAETGGEQSGGDDAGDATRLSPYEQFCNDLNQNDGTIYLTGNIKISSPFIIKQKTTIDGNGFSIDAQHKTFIFKTYTTVTLKNLILKNGKSDKGGAIWAVKGGLNVDNCQFISNKATESGGAIFSKGDVTIKNSKFTSNTANEAAGAVAITYGHLTVKDSTFEKNSIETTKSSGYGGAIWMLKSSSKITGTTFKSNKCLSKSLKSHSKATKYKFNGGAVSYGYGTSHSLIDCTFSGNKASNHGGSIFVYKSNSLKIDNCKFDKNRAGYEDGGAISFSGKKMTVTNSKFTNNLAYEDGGAIDSYSLTGKKIYITIKKSTFESNTAYKCAGAIWMGVKTGYTIENSKFIKNKATNAGAIEAEAGTAKITKCTFKSNKAAKVTSWVVKTKSGARLSHSGGAIVVKNKCTITKSTFQGNKATYGNSVKVEGGKLTSKGNKGIK